MDRHYCKQCGRPFNYCRSCVLKTIPHKAAGFCSKECSAAFKAPKIEIPEIVEIEPIVEEVLTEEVNLIDEHFVEDEILDDKEEILTEVIEIKVPEYETDGIHE